MWLYASEVFFIGLVQWILTCFANWSRPAKDEVKAMPQVWQGCKGEKVSVSPASPLTLAAAAAHLPSL